MTKYTVEDNYGSFYEEASNKKEALKIAAQILSSRGQVIITPLEKDGSQAV